MLPACQLAASEKPEIYGAFAGVEKKHGHGIEAGSASARRLPWHIWRRLARGSSGRVRLAQEAGQVEFDAMQVAGEEGSAGGPVAGDAGVGYAQGVVVVGQAAPQTRFTGR
jgi:hypothetical protein